MLLRDLLNHFNIEGDFPQYLLDQPFNEVFLEGKLTKEKDCHNITVQTRQNVTHRMFIRSDDEFPVAVISELPTGLLNGMKFGRSEGVVEYISEL